MSEEANSKYPNGKGLIFRVMTVIVLGLVILVNAGCGTSQTNQPAPLKSMSLQDISNKTRYSIGEFNKVYRLDLKYKHPDGSYMIFNFESIKAQGNKIVINDVIPIDSTKDLVDQALFFELYDQYGKSFSDISVAANGKDDGTTELTLSSDKEDLSKFKYIGVGPIDGDSKEILFQVN